MIGYTVDVTREIVDDSHICVTTDFDEIVAAVENTGIKEPFKCSVELATVTVGTCEFLSYALNFY